MYLFNSQSSSNYTFLKNYEKIQNLPKHLPTRRKIQIPPPSDSDTYLSNSHYILIHLSSQTLSDNDTPPL